MARLSGFHLKGGIGKTMLDLVYPVNSLYLTVGSENPATVLGGSWSKLTGGVLACAGTAGHAAAGAVGGSKKISVGQMPSHIHSGTRSVTTTLRENVEGRNTGGEAAHKLTVNEMPSHAHNVEWPQWTGTDGSPGNGFAYTGNTAIVASASVGGNAAHNNMPPWLAVYMWKRTGGGNRNVAPCGEAVPYAA